MCAVDTELETPKFGHGSAGEKVVHVCGVHCGSLGVRILLPAAASFDVTIARLYAKYASGRWLALVLDEDAPRIGGGLYHVRRGVRNVSQLGLDKMYARTFLLVNFQNVPKGLQYLWQWSASFERGTHHELDYLILYKCVEVYSFKDFARVSRYVPLLPKWSSIEVPMRRVALLPPCVSFLGSRLRNDANSGLWAIVYTS